MSRFVFAFTISVWILIACVRNSGCQLSEGCAAAPPKLFDVNITDETALIVWDSANQTEHFVRNANFETEAEDFGFLVPTPSVPTLNESGGSVLSALAQRTVARVEYRDVEEHVHRLFKPGTGFNFFQSILLGEKHAPTSGALPDAAVQVIDQVKVAGYDATILKASDAQELLNWLGQHDYSVRPALLEWLKSYTEQGWNITAFKISRDESNGSRAVARPVRMTFKTDRPFYPYREPADQRGEGKPGRSRLLRLYVLADKRMEARIGDTNVRPAKTIWANTLPNHDAGSLNRMLLEHDKSSVPILTAANLFLTEFEDHSSPRPGTDELYLHQSDEQDSVERPPIIRTTVRKIYSPDLHKWPFWLSGSGIFLGLWFRRRFAK